MTCVAPLGAVSRRFNFFLNFKPTVKRPLGRPRHRWKDNSGIDIKEKSISMRNCVDSAHDRDYWRALVNAAFNHWVHKPWS